MARHVRTDANIRFGRWLEVKVRIKAGDRVNLTDWFFQFAGKLVELLGWQIPVDRLDGSKFVEQEELLALAVLQAKRNKSIVKMEATIPNLVCTCPIKGSHTAQQ
jgi:hypothetical protein